MTMPSSLADDFRVATSQDVKSWSFGRVMMPRQVGACWEDNVHGTLHDQRIFGPVADYRCACGEYGGRAHEGMICDRCGVRIAHSAIRATRFGHIEFSKPIEHPLNEGSTLLCWPVVSGQFLQSSAGESLQGLYDELVGSSSSGDSQHAVRVVATIGDYLLPVAVAAHDWRLSESTTLARGLALATRD